MLTFTHTVIDAGPPSGTGGYLDVCMLGDLDGDGRLDVVVGSQYSLGLVWYHNPDWQRHVIGPGDFTTDGVVADLNRDGRMDIIASTEDRDQVEWWENLGDPFSEKGWARHAIGPHFAHDLAVADINGDGRLDVIAFKKSTVQELVWYEAPPDPRGEWVPHVIGTPEGEGLAVGDLNGDGRLDLAASNAWYENVDGTGRTWKRHVLCDSWGADCRDVIADINGDGRPDIVLSHSEGKGRLSWFENPGWREHLIEGGPLEGAHSLAAADFDGDGQLDIMVGEMHTSPTRRVLVYRNLAHGHGWERHLLADTGTHNAQVGVLAPGALPAIVGKNYDGPKAVEVWQARNRD